MGKHSAPRPSTTRRRTLATLSVMTIGATGLAVTVPSAYATTKTTPAIKISGSKVPKAIDNPGTGHDVVRITNVPGVRWSVTGDVKDSWKTPFSTSEKFIDVPLEIEATPEPESESVDDDAAAATPAPAPTTATVTATPAPGNTLTSGVTSWTMDFVISTTPVTIPSNAVPVAVDNPGTAKDAITFTAVPGITWKVGSTDVPLTRGTKTVLLSSIDGADEEKVTVTPTAQDGYAGTFGDTTLAFTTGATVPITKKTVEDATSVARNLPGRTRDQLKITPVNGVKWSVCGRSAIAVTKETVVSASCANTGGDVPIVATANKGFEIADSTPTTAHTYTEEFADSSDRQVVTVKSAPGTAGVSPVALTNDYAQLDLAGTSQDAVYVRALPNITWQYAIPQTDKSGKALPLKWSKVGKPAKGTDISIVKVKHAKGAKPTTVALRPVPVDDDFVLTGWSSDPAYSAENAKAVHLFTDKGEVDLTGEAAPTTAGNVVTLRNVTGVSAWTVEEQVTSNVKDKSVTKTVKMAVKVAPYSQVKVTTAGTVGKVTPVLTSAYIVKPAASTTPATP